MSLMVVHLVHAGDSRQGEVEATLRAFQNSSTIDQNKSATSNPNFQLAA
jgi:hypothetical protein